MEITQTISKPFILNAKYNILQKYNPPKGIDCKVMRIADNSQECIMQLFADRSFPNPQEQKSREDVERVIEKFSNRIVADRIKSQTMFKEYNLKDCNYQQTRIEESGNADQ